MPGKGTAAILSGNENAEAKSVYTVIMDSVYITLFCGGKEACCVDCPCSSVQKTIFLDWEGGRILQHVGLQILK